MAAEDGELPKVVKWLRKGGHVDALFSWEDEEGSRSRTLLHAAAALGQLAVAKEVLKRGATVDMPTSLGYTPLIDAAAAGQPLVLLLLLEHSANPDLQNVNGFTAPMAAAIEGHEACVKALLRANANTKLRNKHGRTALQYAEALGHTAIAELLRQHIAPPQDPKADEEAKAAELMQKAEQGSAIGGTSPSSSARPEGAMQIDVGAGIGAEAVPEPVDDVRDRIKSHRSRRSRAPAAATVPFPGSEPPSAAPPAAVAPAPIVPTSEGQGIELAQRGVSEVVLTGCAKGVGLGLNDQNRVTLLEPGGPAAASGLLGLGDRVVSVDSRPLEGRPLQMVMERRDKHVFGVEKLGGRPLEEAFPEVARRLSMSDASDGTAGAGAHQSSFQGQKVLFSLGRSPRNSAAF